MEHIKNVAGVLIFTMLSCIKALMKVILILIAPILSQLNGELLANPNVEKIFLSSFEILEEKSFPAIAFAEDSSLIATEFGEIQSVSIRVFDEFGIEIPNPEISWEATEPGRLEFTSTAPNSADIRINLFSIGSTQFKATYEPLNISATGHVTFAIPESNTILLRSSYVSEILGDRNEQHTVGLIRNSATEIIKINDTLVTGDGAGLLVRVVNILNEPDQIIFTVVPAKLNEVFESYLSVITGDLVRQNINVNESGTTIQLINNNTNEIISSNKINDIRLSRIISCSGDLVLGTNIEISDLNIGVALTPKIINSADENDSNSFTIELNGQVSAIADVSVNLSSEVTAKGTCEANLKDLSFKSFHFLPFSLSPRISPKISIDGEINSNVVQGWTPVEGISRSWGFRASSTYDSINGWRLNTSYSGASATPPSASFFSNGEFGVSLNADASLGAGFDLCFGICTFLTKIGYFDFFRLAGELSYSFEMSSPFDPGSIDYTGPQYEVSSEVSATAGIMASLFSDQISEYIPVELSVDLSEEIFNERSNLVHPMILVENLSSVDRNGTNISIDAFMSPSFEPSGIAQFWIYNSNGTRVPIGPELTNTGRPRVEIDESSVRPSLNPYEVYVTFVLDEPFFSFTSRWPLIRGPIGSFEFRGVRPRFTGLASPVRPEPPERISVSANQPLEFSASFADDDANLERANIRVFNSSIGNGIPVKEYNLPISGSQDTVTFEESFTGDPGTRYRLSLDAYDDIGLTTRVQVVWLLEVQ